MYISATGAYYFVSLYVTKIRIFNNNCPIDMFAYLYSYHLKQYCKIQNIKTCMHISFGISTKICKIQLLRITYRKYVKYEFLKTIDIHAYFFSIIIKRNM